MFLVCYSFTHSGISWIEFLNSSDNLGDVLTHLREGDMKGAQLLWLRYEVKKQLHVLTWQPFFMCHYHRNAEMHYKPFNTVNSNDEINLSVRDVVCRHQLWWCLLLCLWQGQMAAGFDDRKLEAILNAIPEDLLSQDLCPWFRTVFVPFVRRVLPTGQVSP